ncbi:MAG: class I SAM-dependent methyltransferase [Euzebyaceae bacterium]|nr:class I SAM-dependent methyltransferase [Euzebyaceae bacterium]
METTPTQDEWNARTLALLEDAYLTAPDSRGGSGFTGDAARWQHARRVIVSAIDRDGSFFDVGCANGLLLESVVAWAAEDGHRLEPHGLELSAPLAELARKRLHCSADHLHVGDVTAWRPARRYDFVRTELEVALEHERRDLVQRCLAELLAPGGRLILCSYGSSSEPAAPLVAPLRQWGFDVAGSAEVSEGGTVITRVAWLDQPGIS